jgi:hypothetical protein
MYAVQGRGWYSIVVDGLARIEESLLVSPIVVSSGLSGGLSGTCTRRIGVVAMDMQCFLRESRGPSSIEGRLIVDKRPYSHRASSFLSC